jgi:primosomal protein N' (replication factor Y)
MKNDYIQVIVPLAIPKILTYALPKEWEHTPMAGKRVLVPVGKQRIYTGLAIADFIPQPDNNPVKEILDCIDDTPLTQDKHIGFWLWISQYYLCTPGEVLLAAMPAGMRLDTDTVIIKGPVENPEMPCDEAFLILDALSLNGKLSFTEAQQILQKKNIQFLLTHMQQKGWIEYGFEAKEKVKPKKITFYSLPEELQTEHHLKIAIDSLAKAPKQQDTFLVFLGLCEWFNGTPRAVRESEITSALKNNKTALKSLTEKGLLTLSLADPNGLGEGEKALSCNLSPRQKEALHQINVAFQNKKPAYLHGVTGSGKTEIYLELAAPILESGQDVWFLVPEISLTTQMRARISARFPGDVLVYHSRISDGERVTVWQQLQKKNREKGFLILGARSALLLPLQKPGLIILDEEHDSSYKQSDPAPRYHARDCALWLAHKENIPIIMGSATPSAESRKNIQDNKFQFIELSERFGNAELPEIQIVDMKKEKEKGAYPYPFSSTLMDAMNATLKAGQQIILFQNRRGFAPVLQCKTCGLVTQCPACDISLTFHKTLNEVRCHACGHANNRPTKCEACGSHEIILSGLGTEKVEEALASLFPDVKTDRLDMDNTRKKNAFQLIINEFEQGKTQILVGTQMIAKGLDFHNVGLVGVLNADNLMYFPDFRASEKALQLLLQVAGRAGRRENAGKVIIQTYSPNHPVITHALSQTYLNMLDSELKERQTFEYPPFTRLIKVIIKHKNEERARTDGNRWVATLQKKLPELRINGPEAPLIKRIRNKYLQQIIIRIPKNQSPNPIKTLLNEILTLHKQSGNQPSDITLDVDPL